MSRLFLDMTEGDCPKPLNTAENLEALLREHGVAVRLDRANCVSLEFGNRATEFLNSAPWAAQFGCIKSITARAGLPTSDLVDYLYYIAAKSRSVVVLGMEGVH